MIPTDCLGSERQTIPGSRPHLDNFRRCCCLSGGLGQ